MVRMYNAIARATTENIMQRRYVQKPKGKLKSNSKSIVQIIQKWGGAGKKEHKNKKTGDDKKQNCKPKPDYITNYVKY